jgi:hypothetical protein
MLDFDVSGAMVAISNICCGKDISRASTCVRTWSMRCLIAGASWQSGRLI